MASAAYSNTLTGTTAEPANLSDCVEYIEVINRHATNGLWFTYRWDHENVEAPTTAVAAADEAFFVGAGLSLVFPARSSAVEFSVVGDGNPYTIQSY